MSAWDTQSADRETTTTTTTMMMMKEEEEEETTLNQDQSNLKRKITKELIPTEDEHSSGDDDDDDDDEEEEEEGEDDDSGTDNVSNDAPTHTSLQRAEPIGDGGLPAVFQTNHLVFYERFKAYQDYILGDCKPSEVRSFTADYLEKVVEPCDWRAVWHTELFDVLVEVVDVDYKQLKVLVELVVPLQCEVRGCDLTDESIRTLLEATLNKVPLQELLVVYDESGEFDQTALALEHLRFFYKHLWRQWDEEDEDNEFDYFVRCVEPRLRLCYDILEDRVPGGLAEEYHTLVQRCNKTFQEFSRLRNGLSSDSETEVDNVSMVEGLRMYEQMETLQRRLRIIENPLLRYVLGYRMNCTQHTSTSKGSRPDGGKTVHIVSSCISVQSLHNLMNDKLLPLYSGRDFQLQFHSEPFAAVASCYEGDVVVVCPGHYVITSPLSIADSILLEGYGLPDEIVIEKQNKGDAFVESIAAEVKIYNLKFIQHDAIEGILCVRQGVCEMENCVLQCETTGVIVRTAAQLEMKMCDLYGAKGAGVEIYPGSVCTLVGNGIHHCKDGVLIKDFADEMDVQPKITMVNNVIHNNSGYGVILVKPDDAVPAETELEVEPAGVEASVTEGGAMIPENRTADKECAAETEAQSPCGSPAPDERPVDLHLTAVPTEFTTGNDVIKRELLATSMTKRRTQRSRTKDVGSVRNDENLLSQEMFVSIHGNQFRRNGVGSFGTFLY